MSKAKSHSLGSIRSPSGSNRIEINRTHESPVLVYLDSQKEGKATVRDPQSPESRPWVSQHQHEAVRPARRSSSNNKFQEDQEESLKVVSLVGMGALQKITQTCKASSGKILNGDRVPSNHGTSPSNDSLVHYNARPVTSIAGRLRGATSNQPVIGLPNAMEQHSYEKRSSSNERHSVVDIRETQSPPPTPRKTAVDRDDHDKRDQLLIHVSKQGRSSYPSPVTNAKVLDVGTPQQGSKDKSSSVGLTLPWQKRKRHQRSKSLEMPAPTVSTTEPRNPLHRTSEILEQSKTSDYSSFVRDLMELSLDKLQLPTLAKPSPTSFLTGHDSEVLRTCEYEAAPFQMEIPSLSEFLVVSRLTEFVENYRRIDQNIDLQDWKCKTIRDLQQVKVVEHIPIAQLLIDCGEDVSIQGVVAKGSNADSRIEAVIFEGQQNFVVVLRGTTELQAKPNPKKSSSRKAVPIDAEHEHVEVYKFFLDEYMKVEKECFALLDTLIEEHPFCDVIFTGYSFGGALSILAALRYSNARPMVRVNSYPMGSPKVGFSEFRRLVNSSPNLRVMRLEFGQDGKCQLPGQGGSHVGHTLVLNGSLGNNSLKVKEPVLAFKFEAPKHKKFKTSYPDQRSYVVALEEIARLNLPWATDFVGTSGQGVVINNETRQVV